MQTIMTIGLDIAKSVFQVHGVDADGNIVIRRQVKRRYVLAFFQKLPPCLVGIEACGLGRSHPITTGLAGTAQLLVGPSIRLPLSVRDASRCWRRR
jgi:hypothetical protein